MQQFIPTLKVSRTHNDVVNEVCIKFNTYEFIYSSSSTDKYKGQSKTLQVSSLKQPSTSYLFPFKTLWASRHTWQEKSVTLPVSTD